jgi:hypothetical protein
MLLSGAFACGSESTRPREPAPAPSLKSGTEIVAPSASADAGTSASSSADAGVAVQTSSAVSDVLELPGDPCRPTTATSSLLQGPGAGGLTFDQAGIAGTRRFAFDSASLAFLTFASDGSSVSAPIYRDLAALAGSAAGGLQGLAIDEASNLISVSFDAQGNETGTPIQLAGPGSEGHALAVGPESSLAVWCSNKELQGALLAPTGESLSSFSLGKLSCGDDGARPAALWTEPNFTVVWSRIVHAGTSAVSWAALDASGSVLATRTVLARAEQLELAAVSALADRSLALLVSEGFPAQSPLLLFLDAFGHPRATAYRLLGAVEPWSLASQGAQVGVAARSSDERAVFRAISSAGEALAPWVCLDDAAPGTKFTPRAALFADTAGYGVVARRSDGSAAYFSTDDQGSAQAP